MIQLLSFTLENEMDLVLAHKRSMQVAEKIGLTLSTQTTFATAVSEIARTVIEQTDHGWIAIGLEQQQARFSLCASVEFDPDISFTNNDAGFFYAQKLVPGFEFISGEKVNQILMTIGLPRSLKLDPIKIAGLRRFFEIEPPMNAYDEIKKRNTTLNRIAGQQEELIRQSQLIDEKKTEFMSVASHEIKTPMTVLKAYTQMAKSTKEPISERLRGLLEKIDVQSNKLMSLVHQLMDISRIENGSLQYDFTPIPLNSFLTNQVAVMQQILPDYQLELVLDHDVQVPMDQLRMEQVFSNLIGNAAKYSTPGTTIVVTSEMQDDTRVRIEVRDAGKGISTDQLKAIFEKFYRTEDVLKNYSGLGMGLFVTSKIITDHKGEIWAESEIGVGSSFYFTLPVSDQLH